MASFNLQHHCDSVTVIFSSAPGPQSSIHRSCEHSPPASKTCAVARGPHNFKPSGKTPALTGAVLVGTAHRERKGCGLPPFSAAHPVIGVSFRPAALPRRPMGPIAARLKTRAEPMQKADRPSSAVPLQRRSSQMLHQR